MDHEQSSRKKFLQLIGLTAGGTLLSGSAKANISEEEVRRLSPEQHQFIGRYEKWMDEYIKVIRIQNEDPDNAENHKAKVALTEKAEEFKPELALHLKDEAFALIFRSNLQRMTNEIKV